VILAISESQSRPATRGGTPAEKPARAALRHRSRMMPVRRADAIRVLGETSELSPSFGKSPARRARTLRARSCDADFPPAGQQRRNLSVVKGELDETGAPAPLPGWPWVMAQESAKAMPTPPNANIRLKASMGPISSRAPIKVRLCRILIYRGTSGCMDLFPGSFSCRREARETQNSEEKEKRGRSRSFAPSETPVRRRKTGESLSFINV